MLILPFINIRFTTILPCSRITQCLLTKILKPETRMSKHPHRLIAFSLAALLNKTRSPILVKRAKKEELV